MADKKILSEMQRNTVKNLLDLVVMVKLRQGKPMNGHEITYYVQQKYGVVISPGTVYSLLCALERKGTLTASFASGKRMYKLSSEGLNSINNVLEMKGEIIRFVDFLLS